MKKLSVIFIVLLIFTFVGCSNKATSNEIIVKEYVEAKGYKITESKGEIYRYTLEKRKICGGTETIPYQQAWSVQTIEPYVYFGKEIIIYGFIVKNHPLQEIDKHAEKGVVLSIMVADGEVIGGYSYPNANVVGAFSSLDGKSLEEVTGLSFQQWSEAWEEKYAN